MMVCTFFGHSDCYGLDSQVLREAIEKLIMAGVDTFYVGHQGHFDSMAASCLSQLAETYPNISYSVVLAYLPTQKDGRDVYHDCSIYPEGLETVPPRFAIERRNKWMIDNADYCLCYINHTQGGADKFARMAKRKGLVVVNLGSTEL